MRGEVLAVTLSVDSLTGAEGIDSEDNVLFYAFKNHGLKSLAD